MSYPNGQSSGISTIQDEIPSQTAHPPVGSKGGRCSNGHTTCTEFEDLDTHIDDNDQSSGISGIQSLEAYVLDWLSKYDVSLASVIPLLTSQDARGTAGRSSGRTNHLERYLRWKHACP